MIASLACGCITRAEVTDPALLDQLGFLQPGAVARSTVEARIGLPEQSFESGSIAAYHLFEADGLLISAQAKPGARYWLMLQYSPDGVLVRRSLVRAP